MPGHPFVNVIIAKTFIRLFTPDQAGFTDIRIEINLSAGKALQFDIVFPELHLTAVNTPSYFYIRRFEKSWRHSGTAI